MNEASALAIRIVVAVVIHEALLFASLVALHAVSFELGISDILSCCSLETELMLFTFCPL